jgi:hypothetical protein
MSRVGSKEKIRQFLLSNIGRVIESHELQTAADGAFGKKHTENTKRKMRKAHAVTWADPILSAEIVARRNKTRKFNQQTNKEKSYDEGRL